MSVDHRIRSRNRGLRRVSLLTSWTVGGGALLSGGFSYLAAQQFTDHANQVAAAKALASRQPVDSASALSPSAVAPLQKPANAPSSRTPTPTTPKGQTSNGSGTGASRNVSNTPPATARPRPTVTVPVTQPAPRYSPPPVVSGGT